MGRKDDERPSRAGALGRLVAKLHPRDASTPSPSLDVAPPGRPDADRAPGVAGPAGRASAGTGPIEPRARLSDAPMVGREDRRAEGPGDEEQPRRVVLRLQNFQSAVDAQIAQARKRGDFDNLPGKGKPLDLREQPGEAEGTWAAHRVLKGAGMQLPWVALAQEIDADLDACRKIRERMPLATRIRRRELLADYEERARAARQKTARYNLMVPHMQLQRHGVDAEGMIRDAREEVEALERG